MILIGQFDSPFVRRVGIALTVYGMAFEHRPWSVFGNADQIRVYNPLMRVPTLVLDDGDVLVCSATIIDYLDGLVAPDCRLFPIVEPDRHRALAVAALGTGLADKAVSLFYERRLHQETSDIWVDRCRRQIDGVLEALEAGRSGQEAPYWFGSVPGHADIAVAAAIRFVTEAHPGLISWSAYPALTAFAARMEALPAFQAIAQPFNAPTT